MKKQIHSISFAPVQLDMFGEYISQVLQAISKEGSYRISQSVFISRVEYDHFYYSGHNWQSEYRINFRDIESIIRSGACSRAQIKLKHDLPAMARLHAGYYSSIAYDFLNFNEIARAFSRPVRRFAA